MKGLFLIISNISEDVNNYQGVGRLNESNLHESLKYHYSNDKSNHEYKVGRFHIDVKLENELVEIQTGSLGNIRNKLQTLLKTNNVRLVLPVFQTKFIVKFNRDGTFKNGHGTKGIWRIQGEWLIITDDRLPITTWKLRLQSKTVLAGTWRGPVNSQGSLVLKRM